MTDTTPGLVHHAEPKRSIGVYNVTPFSDATTIFDTGMRFYIEPVKSELEAWGPDDNSQQIAEQYLEGLCSGDECKNLTPDKFLDWCTTEGNEINVLGISRVLVSPQYAQSLGIVDPSSANNTKAAAAQGL